MQLTPARITITRADKPCETCGNWAVFVRKGTCVHCTRVAYKEKQSANSIRAANEEMRPKTFKGEPKSMSKVRYEDADMHGRVI